MAIAPFTGSETFKAPVERVYALLTTAGELKDCMPDVVSTEVVSDLVLKGKVAPSFSFIRTKLSFTLTIERTEVNKVAKNRNASDGIGARITIESTMHFSPTADGGTKVDWEGRLTELKGLVSMAPAGLITGAAEKTIAATWALVRKKLGE